MVDFNIVPAQISDRNRLSSFLNFQTHIHRHLDWRSPLDWLGQQPFLLAEEKGNIRAVLACPPDPAEIYWVRVFASSNLILPRPVWMTLLAEIIESLKNEENCRLVSLALQSWFEDLLISSQFTTSQDIIVLEWNGRIPPAIAIPDSIQFRKMQEADLPVVKVVDQLAFDPLWHNSINSLTSAFKQSSSSTVAFIGNEIIGYQMSTSVSFSGHLARLAVLPAYQGKNIGYNLVYNLLRDFNRSGLVRITVNTQSNNAASIALYEKMGFHKTGEKFPVYEFPLR